MEEIRSTPAAKALWTTANAKPAERQEYVTERADAEALKTIASAQSLQDANERLRSERNSLDTLQQGYGHLQVVDDVRGAAEPTPGGSLRAPQGGPVILKSELDEYEAAIAGAERAREKKNDAHAKQQRRQGVFNDAQGKITRAVSQLIASDPRRPLDLFESSHDFDAPSVECIKDFLGEAAIQSKVVDDLGNARPLMTDEDIEALVPPADAPVKLIVPTYAQRSSGLLGGRPNLRWDSGSATGAAPRAPGMGATVEGDAVKIAIWLGRERLVAELKRQAAELAAKHGTMDSEAHKAALREAQAEHHRLELEASAAWWRCVEAGFDTLPPPVSGRALLLIL